MRRRLVPASRPPDREHPSTAPAVRKERVEKEDGRYMILYHFGVPEDGRRRDDAQAPERPGDR